MCPPHFLSILLEVKASGPPHVLKLWLGVCNGMRPVNYVCSNRASFCVSRISWRSLDFHKVQEFNLVTLAFGVITGFMTLVSVLCCCICVPVC